MTEAEFQRNVIQLAGIFGWHVAHFRPARTKHGWRTAMAGDPGYPDLTLARRGRVITAELKSDTGKVTPDQQAWLDALAGNPAAVREAPGIEVYVWRPRDIDEISKVLR